METGIAPEELLRSPAELEAMVAILVERDRKDGRDAMAKRAHAASLGMTE
jgi:hypothetical protein